MVSIESRMHHYADQVYKRIDEISYGVVKSRFTESVGAKVNNFVVDSYLESETKTVVFDQEGKLMGSNFNVSELTPTV
jgi:hypothetical protein